MLDNSTRYPFAIPLGRKSSVTHQLAALLKLLLKRGPVLALRTDNGGEFLGNELANYLRDAGMSTTN